MTEEKAQSTLRPARTREKLNINLPECKNLCLFCLTDVLAGVNPTELQMLVPVPQGHDWYLGIRLDNHTKNIEAFDYFCSLLYIKWANRGMLRFDRRQCLPLCQRCQYLYQELYQVQVQIKELGRLMKRKVELITSIVNKSEKRKKQEPRRSVSTTLELYGLDYIREKLINRRSTGNDSDNRDTEELNKTGSEEVASNSFDNSGQSKPTEEVDVDMPNHNNQSLELELTNKAEEIPIIGSVEFQHDLLGGDPYFQESHWREDENDDDFVVSDLDCGEDDDVSQAENVFFPRTCSKRKTKDKALMEIAKLAKKIQVQDENDGYELLSDESDCDMDKDENNTQLKHRSQSIRISGRQRPIPTTLTINENSQCKAPDVKKPESKQNFTCHLCDETINGRMAFSRHYIKEHPEEKRYTCKYCKKHFKGLFEVTSHQNKHSGLKAFECSYCLKTFSAKKTRNNHQRWVHEGVSKKYTCKICKKSFSSPSMLKMHEAVHEETVVLCKSCGKTYKTEYSFGKHNKEYHEGKAKCTAPMLNPTEEDIKALGLGSSGPGVNSCHICWKTILGKHNIKSHFDQFHDGHSPLKCAQCGKKFPWYKDARRHVLRHLGHKPFQCDKCPKRFLTTTELRNHKISHLSDSEKPKFICEICGSAYTTKGNLVMHKKLHTEGKPRYVCEICGKSYAERKGYQYHKKSVHLNQTPHQCNYCPKSFVGVGELGRHLRTHTKQKPYKCPLCDKHFPYSNSRTRHIREVHHKKKTKSRKIKAAVVKQPSEAPLPPVNNAIDLDLSTNFIDIADISKLNIMNTSDPLQVPDITTVQVILVTGTDEVAHEIII